MTDDEFRRFAQDCSDELQRKQAQIAELAILDNAPRLDEGRIDYSANGVLFIEADVGLVGSRGLRSETWLWGWANTSFGEANAANTASLRELQSITGDEKFGANTPFPATADEAWTFAAIACRHLDGAGVVRLTANDSDWFFVVRNLTRHRADSELLPLAETAVHRSLLQARGPAVLNLMRKRFPELRVNLTDADLRGAPNPWAHDLHVQGLFDVSELQKRALQEMYPDDAVDPGPFVSHRLHDLSGANLSLAALEGTILRGVVLRNASLENASLVEADLSRADLRGASLRHAFLNGTNLTGANLAGADFAGAELSRTVLADVDLSKVKGLDDVNHFGPSEISMSTLVASNFDIDPAFLRKAGVSRGLIQDLRRGKRLAGSYETCFLSYSSKDREFAMQLYTSLTHAGVRVFWDYYDVLPGEELERQIAEAIRELKRLVVVLSPDSMSSDWVAREVQLAWGRRRESLLPIRLCPIEAVKQWTLSREGLPDLANVFPIQDFSDWRTPASFAHAFSLLLQALGGSRPVRRSSRRPKSKVTRNP